MDKERVNKTFLTTEELWIELKVFCVQQQIEISNFISEAIKEKLKRDKK